MPYDALGNYIPGDDEPSLDQMRLALTKTPSQPQQQSRPLDSVTDTLKRMATEFNPLMMGRTLQDAPKILYNAAVAPVASTWAGALRNIQAAGAEQAYGALGMQPEAAAAQSRIQPVTTQSLQAPLSSAAGQQIQEALGEAFNALHLPPMGPGSGMPGTARLTPRPMLTPNDVRVMGAQATHAIREAGQIPTDIANVRNAGIQRMSPLTGEPSVGSRLGSAIEGTSQAAGRVGDVARDVGQSTADYMQMRRDMGLSPVPGVPTEFFPDLNMYAVRPAGTSLVSPKVPPTKDVTDLNIGIQPYEAIRDTGADKPELRPSDVLPYLHTMDLDIPRTSEPGVAPIVQARQDAFDKFVVAKAREMYPDAPSDRVAVDAFDARFSRQSDKDISRIQLYDEFRNSPEGQTVSMGDLPSSTDLQERHTAAAQWLNSTFLNYVKRHVGAEGDPLVQLASQGITMLPAENVRQRSQVDVNEDVLRRTRSSAWMPVAGTLAPAIRDKSVELGNANVEVEQLQQQREQYRNLAMQQGLPDPAMLPEYAATTNPLQVAVAKRDKLQDELGNLQLGRDYEKIADASILVNKPSELLSRLPYESQQFYPSITRARPDEKLYSFQPSSRKFENIGLNELASQFYDDVLRGDMPIDKLKGLTVEKYVRGKAEGRILEEKRQAQAAMQMKADIESRMQRDMAQYVKPENYFGNIGVLELSTSTGFDIDEIRRLVSDDTLALDHCVAEGPTPGSKDKNLWRDGADRRYMPLVDPVTGQFRTDSPRQYTRYILEAGNQDPQLAGMLASVRDKSTGVPVATIEFKHLANGEYSIGYASGYQNGNVKKEYHDAIKEYLNSRANVIHDASSDLSGVGLIDLHSTEALNEAMRILGVPRREAAAALNQAVDSGQLPRFGSNADLRQALESPPLAAQQPAVQPPVARQPDAQQPDTQQGITAADLYNYLRDVAQAYGRDEGDAMLRAVRQARQTFDGAPWYDELLRDQPTAFAERIAEIAQQQDNAIVEQELLTLADRIAPPVPPAQQPANPFDHAVFPPAQQLANFDVHGMARDLLENARRDNQTFDTGDLGSSLFTLTHGNFDDFRFRALGADSAAAQRQVADALRQLMQDAGIQMPGLGVNQQPANAAAQFDRAPFDDAMMNFDQALTELAMEEGTYAPSIAEIDRVLDDLQHGANAIYGLYEGDAPLTDPERAYLIQQLQALRQEHEIHATENLDDWEPDPDHPANQPAAAQPVNPQAANFDVDGILRGVDSAMAGALADARLSYDLGRAAVQDIEERMLRHQMDEESFSVANLEALLTDVTRAAAQYRLARNDIRSLGIAAVLDNFAGRLTALSQDIRDGEYNLEPPAQGYQEGGSVKYPNFIDAQNVAIQRSQQMSPSEDTTDNTADAARHMLASGYMAKSFNPTIAKGLGWLHEAKEAPFRTIGHALGLSNPRYDYEMDMHNNALGIELAKKAKDRADFERMVQESLKQSATTTAPGRPRVLTQKQAIEGVDALKYAIGGTVSQPQSLDAMKYELMMRSK